MYALGQVMELQTCIIIFVFYCLCMWHGHGGIILKLGAQTFWNFLRFFFLMFKNNNKGKLQITHPKVSEFEFYPLNFGSVWILHLTFQNLDDLHPNFGM